MNTIATPQTPGTIAIAPTIGRRVWYWPGSSDVSIEGMYRISADQPFDAGIVYVHNDHSVNLIVTDHGGHTHRRNSVYLVQPGDERPNYPHATWMPFQAGQARQQTELKADLKALHDKAMGAVAELAADTRTPA